jgi:hypothetical protein
MFYFSGHGTAMGKRNYLFPPGYEPNRVEDTSVSTLKVFQELDGTGARHRVVVVDACRAGAKLDMKGFVEEIPAFGRFELYAASEHAVAFEESEFEHGVFTQGVLEALRGKADDIDDSPDGRVTLDEVKKYTEKFVYRWARKNRRTQMPRFGGDFQGEPASVVLALAQPDSGTSFKIIEAGREDGVQMKPPLRPDERSWMGKKRYPIAGSVIVIAGAVTTGVLQLQANDKHDEALRCDEDLGCDNSRVSALNEESDDKVSQARVVLGITAGCAIATFYLWWKYRGLVRDYNRELEAYERYQNQLKSGGIELKVDPHRVTLFYRF